MTKSLPCIKCGGDTRLLYIVSKFTKRESKDLSAQNLLIIGRSRICHENCPEGEHLHIVCKCGYVGSRACEKTE